jgi:hypothetical protein
MYARVFPEAECPPEAPADLYTAVQAAPAGSSMQETISSRAATRPTEAARVTAPPPFFLLFLFFLSLCFPPPRLLASRV